MLPLISIVSNILLHLLQNSGNDWNKIESCLHIHFTFGYMYTIHTMNLWVLHIFALKSK